MSSYLRDHLPLGVLAGWFLALASAAQCTRGDEPEPSPAVDGGPQVDASTRACATDNDCSPPPSSSCQSENELAFYTDPQCVQAHCQWTRQIRKIGRAH